MPTDEFCNVSPIILNMASGGYELTSMHEGVVFDIDANGAPDQVSWTSQGSALAFLALDRNGNGLIDDGAELFGDASPIAAGKAANGFEALSQYDENLDGSIDVSDAVWPRLRLWRDANHNGISEPTELTPVDASDIRKLGLDYHWTGRHDKRGNVFRYESKVQFRQGSKPYYDVFLVKVN